MVKPTLNFTDIFDGLWKDLVRGSRDRKSEYRWLNFSTTELSGRASIRTVVLREAIKNNRILRIFSDFRAKKVEQIKINPFVTAHFHDRRKGIQLRMLGTAYLANKELTHSHWIKLSEQQRKFYKILKGPGELYESDKENACYLEENAHKFCVIETKITEIDWLSLNNKEHLRVKFQCSNSDIKIERITP
ncbi:MAG: hypothetical protein CMM44_03300 [Rhodospirillaceae bacterium]|nr:hypothetical protein [Rhodospirillaceae bacterium]|tara:strand:+ start:2339 stop:2908 length:570 start_codon:yes stop_codon:yes gene_type:complete